MIFLYPILMMFLSDYKNEMSFFKGGNSISTRELAEKCELQEAQLKKTKTRLANLVAAYKTLQVI